MHQSQPPVTPEFPHTEPTVAVLDLHNQSHKSVAEPGSLHKSADPLSDNPPDPQESAGGLAGFAIVLKNRNFLILWSGQVFSQLADKVSLVLMVSLISAYFKAQEESISGWVSAIMVAFTLPAILFGTVAGVYVDRWSKKLVLVGSNLFRGILILAIPILLWLSQGNLLGTLPVGFLELLMITFLVSTLTQYFAPAEQSAIPLIVAKPNLLSANSLYTTTMMASVIVGFAIGEPLLSLARNSLGRILPMTGSGPSLFVGGTYIVAGLILVLLRPQETRSVDTDKPNLWNDIRVGLTFLGQTPVVRAALFQLVTLFSVFAALAVLSVRMAELSSMLRPSQFGLLLASAGLGMGIGAFWTGHSGHRLSRRVWTVIGSIILAIALAALAWTSQNLVPSLILIGLVGVAGACVGIPMQTVIQEETPEALRGKVFGLQNNVVNIALSLPLALAGVAETYWGLTPVLLSLAGLTALSSAVTWQLSSQLD